ncbi:MAG: hypothetical protein OXC27_14545 [Caldilineaceae bacterium]|nr:hypothetical protein [Caldilineaceae bacterium]
MRTTLNIDDDLLAVARALAERNGTSLGSAISEPARRGFADMDNLEFDDCIPFFRVAPNARTITNEDVKEALSNWP